MFDPSTPQESLSSPPAGDELGSEILPAGDGGTLSGASTRKVKPLKIVAIGAGAVLLLCAVACLGMQFYPLLMEKLSASQLMGQAAPDFTLSTLDGQQITLSALRGKPVALNFWATWCPSCVTELPDLQQAYQTHQGEAHFYAISLDADPAEVPPFLTTHAVNLPVLLDTEGDAAAKYRVRGIPVTVFIDAQGMIAARHIGSLSAGKFSDYLRQITAGSK